VENKVLERKREVFEEITVFGEQNEGEDESEN